MRNKKIVQNRLSKLNGLIRRQDMNVNRGGTKEEYNSTHQDILSTLQDLMDIIEREA